MENFRIPKKKTSKTGDGEAGDLPRGEEHASANNSKHSQAPGSGEQAQSKAGGTEHRPRWIPSEVTKVIKKPPGGRTFDRRPAPKWRGKTMPRNSNKPPSPERRQPEPERGERKRSSSPPETKQQEVQTPDPKPRQNEANKETDPQNVCFVGFGKLPEHNDKVARGSQTRTHRWVSSNGLSGPTVTVERDLRNLRREVDLEAKQYLKIGHEWELKLYSDGGCYYNGKEGAFAAAAVYHRDDSNLNYGEMLPMRRRQTNNTAEITAARVAVERATRLTTYKRIAIVTDSALVANGWAMIPFWEKNGWRKTDGTPVKNRAEFKELEAAVAKVPGLTLRFILVPGHSGVPGNTAAHNLATQALVTFEKRLNEARYAEDPESLPIRFVKSSYGPKEKEEVDIPQPTPSSIRQDIIAKADLQRSMELKKLLDKAGEDIENSKRFWKNVAKFPDRIPQPEGSSDLRAELEKREKQKKDDDLRNVITIKRKNPAQSNGGPAAKVAPGGNPWDRRSPGKSVSGTSSSSNSSSSSSGSSYTETPNQRGGRVHQKKIARQREIELKLASLEDTDPRAAHLRQLLIQEEIKKENRRMKLKRKAERRRTRNIDPSLRQPEVVPSFEDTPHEDLAALELSAPIGPAVNDWSEYLDFEAESVRADSPDKEDFTIGEDFEEFHF
jgi:ribonuclease HI